MAKRKPIGESWRAVRDRVREQLDARNAEHVPEVYLLVGEREAYALAGGFLPTSVRAQAKAAVEWNFSRPRRRGRRR